MMLRLPFLAAVLHLLIAAPLPIGYGQTATGQLSSAQPEVLYIFSAQAGDVITITLDRLDGLIDPLLVLIDETQTNVLAVDNDSGGDHNARLRYVIPSDARYVIKATAVQGGDLNGSYQLTLTLGNPTATPSPKASAPRVALLKPGEAITADLDQTTRFRLYGVSLKKGETISAALKAAASLQAGLYLYTADFRELTRAELGSALNYRASADGLYLLMAAQAAGAGEYTLIATIPDTGAMPIEAPFLIPGQAQKGTLGEHIGAVYRFDAQPGTAVDLMLTGVDTVLLLADSEFNQVASSSDGQLRGVLLPHPGRYAIFVIRPGGPNDITVGDFNLTLRGEVNATPAPTASGPAIIEIAYGRTVNDAITAARPRIFYSFQGIAGDVVTIQLSHISGNTLDPLLYLYSYTDGTPTLIASTDNRAQDNLDAAILSFTLPRTGTYLIVATSSRSTAGSFILGLSRG